MLNHLTLEAKQRLWDDLNACATALAAEPRTEPHDEARMV